MMIKKIKNLLDCELTEISPFIVIAGKRYLPDNEYFVRFTKEKDHDIIEIDNIYYGCIEEKLTVKLSKDESLWKRSVKNISKKPIDLNELGIEFSGISFNKPQNRNYFYHVENARIYNRMAIGIEEFKNPLELASKGDDYDPLAGNKWIDPGVVRERIGASPYQPFPAILLSNYESSQGLVHGTLSQDVFYHNYIVKHDQNAIDLSIFSSFKGISHLQFEPGATLEDHFYIGKTDKADCLDSIFSSYISVLKKVLPASYGQNDTNRHSVVWGSWNDGIFRDIDEKRILKMTDFISKNIPTIDWVQIDDGYSKLSTVKNGSHGIGSFYEDNNGIDETKFPSGFKDLTNKIKSRGLKPALWLGVQVPHAGPLFKEHPDWFIDYSYRMKAFGILDVSISEVREYMERALDFYIDTCGFEGVKLDFWTYSFEDSHDLLKNSNKSGYEWRAWWLEAIRKRLPEYGFLEIACDIGMGNPFLARYVTNYRYGIDIGNGKWENVRINFLWGAACFALHIGDMFIPNSDGVGLFPGLTDQETLSCINYCMISGSLVEASGWLYQEQDNPRMKWALKSLACPNNGRDVYFAQYDYRTDNASSPEIWYIKTPHFSLFTNDNLPSRTMAIFNLGEQIKEYTFSSADFELDNDSEYYITNVWTNETMLLKDQMSITLDPHESIMFSINCDFANYSPLIVI